MFSEKQFQAWRAQRGAVEGAERARIRGIVEDEVSRVMDGPASQSGIEAGRAHFAGVMARTRGGCTPSQPTGPERQIERRAEIRRGVEAEMRQWNRERQGRPAPASTAQTRAAADPGTVDFGGNRYAVEGTRWRLLGPSPATRQVPPGTRVGEVRTVQGFRYQWNGRTWVDGVGRAMPLAAA